MAFLLINVLGKARMQLSGNGLYSLNVRTWPILLKRLQQLRFKNQMHVVLYQRVRACFFQVGTSR